MFVTAALATSVDLPLIVVNASSCCRFTCISSLFLSRFSSCRTAAATSSKTRLGFDKVREARAVVAGLIAAVAFAAGLTLPGGYKSDESDQDRGSAILSHESAFRAFIIADSVAMISALLAIKLNYRSADPAVTRVRKAYKLSSFNLVNLFGHLAEAASVVAFITGLYAVLKPALTLAIATCIIILCFFIGDSNLPEQSLVDPKLSHPSITEHGKRIVFEVVAQLLSIPRQFLSSLFVEEGYCLIRRRNGGFWTNYAWTGTV
ncbi:hypothetical protein F3Y22_tig00110705pilonHSYRG00021 [Hibiscus syriacus]|uniref:PGG domain-containing protein n=1 Tax=Hibiscus syriacus TaxID=106335 RepID=A0A6A2ZW23_HIBSY|nr:hypothetical protein F3Y22_tig00110705pilonHSYRG00021 [Hibiscus syriacus]